jgi:predicted GH43/DUF377 family glycosyl hydrolase
VKLLIALITSFSIQGCVESQPSGVDSTLVRLETPGFIQKTGLLLKNKMESTPVVWTDGRILLVASGRELGTIEIYDGAILVSSTHTETALISAIVSGGRLYVFGSKNFGSPNNTVEVTSTGDLTHWAAPRTVLSGRNDRTYFNTSVTPAANGTFTMAIETCEQYTVCFNVRFFQSTDLYNWTEIGAIFKPDIYAACPTIRYINGFYYVFYLRSNRYFSTYVSRSADLVTWEDSSSVVLFPTEEEGIDNSDMDFVEFNGELIIIYAVGDQTTYTNINSAKYHGSLADFVAEFF